MTSLFNLMVAVSMACWAQAAPPDAPVTATDKPLSSLVRAELRADKTMIPVGSDVMIEFVIQNKTDEPVKLVVPGALEGRARPDLGMGLPLEHVFSGTDFKALEVASEEFPKMGDRVTRKPEFPLPSVTLARSERSACGSTCRGFTPVSIRAAFINSIGSRTEARWKPRRSPSRSCNTNRW